jgi:hypothetical protein
MNDTQTSTNTDLLIVMALPISIVARVKVSKRQKFGLFAVLSLGVFIIGVAIARVIVTDTKGVHPEISWLALWSVVESSVAVLVCCLASFKIMFGTQNASANSTPYHAQGYGTGRDNHEATSFHEGGAIVLTPVRSARPAAARDSWDCDSSSQVEILSVRADMAIHKLDRVQRP